MIFIYEAVNVIISIILSFRLISVKKGIKNLSAAKGEVYENPKIEDVQIYNSVIIIMMGVFVFVMFNYFYFVNC